MKLKSEKRAVSLRHRISKQLPIELFNKFFVEPRDADVDGITMTIQLCARTCANPNSNGPPVYCYFINIPLLQWHFNISMYLLYLKVNLLRYTFEYRCVIEYTQLKDNLQ